MRPSAEMIEPYRGSAPVLSELQGHEVAYLFNMQDVTGYNLGCLDLYHTTTSENDGLKRERLLQFINDGAGLKFLDEAN